MKKKAIASRMLTAGLIISMAAAPVSAAGVNPEGYQAEEAGEDAESAEIMEAEVQKEAGELSPEELPAEVPEEEESAEVQPDPEEQESSAEENAEEETEEKDIIDTENADLEGAWTKSYLFAIADTAAVPEEGSGISYLMDNVYMADTIEQIYAVYKEDEILYIEENSEVELLSDNNDAYYSMQKNYVENVKANAFWDQGVSAAGVTVAVIDSGLYSGHSDLDQSRIAPGYNYVNNNEDTRDTAGHGTQVAGVIAAVRNNGIGVSGLLDGVTILPMRISANSSSSPTIAVVAAALKDAVDKYDVQVVNMSIGQKKESETMEAAVKYAAAHNVIMVAAAGNDGTDALMYPAAYEEVISVGALNGANEVRDNSQKNSSIFVTAPGENIYTTDVNNRYTVKSGTSYSAPFVSAMAAAAKAADRNMSIDTFKNLLISTSVDAGEAGYDTSYGYGTVDIAAFLRALNGTEETASANVTAVFQDAEGQELSAAKTTAVMSNAGYSLVPEKISGYRAVSCTVSNTATKDGTYPISGTAAEKLAFSEIQSGNAVVAYTYEKVQSTTSEGSFEVQYERAYGSSLADAFKAVAQTPDGGYIAVGYTFAPSEEAGWGYNITSEKYPNSNNDAIMVKFDADCKIEWARNFGTSGVEVFEDVSVLQDGTVVAVGRAPYNFGTSKNTASGYIVKLADSRMPDEYEEIHVGGSTGGDYVQAVAAAPDGGYVIAGRTSSYNSEDWTKVHTSTTTADAFIAKYDADGRRIFSKCFSQTEGKRTYFNDVAIDNDGNIIAVGENQTVKHVYNAQIVKFNGTTGEVIWSRSEGSALTEEPDNSVEGHTSAYDSVAVLSDGSYVVTGTTKTTGSSTGSQDAKLLDDASQNWGIAGEKDGIIVHYSKEGKVLKASNIGTPGGTVILSGVVSDRDGGYMVYGQTSDEILGSDEYTWQIKGATDTIVMKYNASDEIQWNQSYGTENKGEWFNDIILKENGELLIVGETNRDSTDGNIDASIWTSYAVEGDKKKSSEEEEIPAYADGVYQGSGIGFNTDEKVVTAVTVKDGKITDVSLVSHQDTKSYMKKATGLLPNIVEKQSANVDTVTGATYSSRGLKRAAGNALKTSAEVAELEEDSVYVYAALGWAEYWNAEGVQAGGSTASSDQTDSKGEYDKGAFDVVSRATTTHGLHRGSYQGSAVIYMKDGKTYDVSYYTGRTTAVLTDGTEITYDAGDIDHYEVTGLKYVPVKVAKEDYDAFKAAYPVVENGGTLSGGFSENKLQAYTGIVAEVTENTNGLKEAVKNADGTFSFSARSNGGDSGLKDTALKTAAGAEPSVREASGSFGEFLRVDINGEYGDLAANMQAVKWTYYGDDSTYSAPLAEYGTKFAADNWMHKAMGIQLGLTDSLRASLPEGTDGTGYWKLTVYALGYEDYVIPFQATEANIVKEDPKSGEDKPEVKEEDPKSGEDKPEVKEEDPKTGEDKPEEKDDKKKEETGSVSASKGTGTSSGSPSSAASASRVSRSGAASSKTSPNTGDTAKLPLYEGVFAGAFLLLAGCIAKLRRRVKK